MAFRFKFQTLLNVRGIQEDMAQQALSQAQRHLSALIAMKEQVAARKDVLKAELMARMKGGLGASEVKRYYDYLFHLDEGIARISGNIENARKQVDEKRHELLEAKKAYKAIERLREIHQERHAAADAKKEMNFIDEIAIMRAGGEK